jgi:hypothetical protein
MENNINVREILGVKENSPLFIKAAGPDKLAAAERLATTEKHFEEWHAAINRTNTRELPPELVRYYDEAAFALCMILKLEKGLLAWR